MPISIPQVRVARGYFDISDLQGWDLVKFIWVMPMTRPKSASCKLVSIALVAWWDVVSTM